MYTISYSFTHPMGFQVNTDNRFTDPKAFCIRLHELLHEPTVTINSVFYV